MDSLINIGIYLTYIMIAFGALAAVGFGIKKMISNNQNTKKTIYTVGGLLLICIISYLLASNELLASYEKYKITSATSKNVGMGLMSFYILAASAIGIVIYTEISKVFSKVSSICKIKEGISKFLLHKYFIN